VSEAVRASALPIVSIVGRPNVGKSTLFNRLTQSRRAIVDSVPGVTRDRIELPVEWRGKWFQMVDTGGIDFEDPDTIPRQIVEQAQVALAASDVVVFMVDARHGMAPVERELADILRRQEVPVVVGANKVDSPSLLGEANEFHSFGLDAVVAISAEQGYGTDDLLDAILERIPDPPSELIEDDAIRVAVIGRPNVGKSSLVNRLLGEERVIVSDIPGTTRDMVDVRLKDGDNEFILLDTAGLKRKGTDKERIDHIARVMARRALERCDVALLLIDAAEGPSHQDAVIAGLAAEKGAGLIVVANKWDLVEEQEEQFPRLVEAIREKVKFASWAPVLTVSVKTGERLHRLFDMIVRVAGNRSRRQPTAALNDMMERALKLHQPPSSGRGKEFKVKYMTQVQADPPTFVAFTTGGVPHFTWQRFVENRLREAFDLEGTPVVVRYRGGKKPGGPRKR
jgi:GTP-binding protein